MNLQTIVIAPRISHDIVDFHHGGNVPVLCHGPKEPGFMAFVEGNKAIWEHGETRCKALEMMRRTAWAAGWSIGKVTYQTKAV